jgi:tRNA(fMet)-specific endonuclease VapC
MNGNSVLLDTNAIIAFQRKDSVLNNVLKNYQASFIPIIAVGELYFGAYKSQRVQENRQAIDEFLVDRILLYPDKDTADIYGHVKQSLQGKGRPIPENDIWIAAIALQQDLVLITKDGHFREVDNLKFRGW